MATVNSRIPLLSFLLFSLPLLLPFSCSAYKPPTRRKPFCSPLAAAACSPASAANGLRDLNSLRDRLSQHEDKIVYCLIQRSNYAFNRRLYDSKQLQLFVTQSEAVLAMFGLYTFEEENPFSHGGLPLSKLPTPTDCTKVLYRPASCFNINDQIMTAYLGLLPNITTKEDDENYAATLASDLTCLQAISRRIHTGKFVAEVKYTKKPTDYNRAILTQNRTALMDLLTDTKVEETVVQRVHKKAEAFGQYIGLDDKIGANVTYKVDPSIVSRFYRDSVIPLTKEVEVEYLLHRMDKL